jgi:hypothetical protein
VAVTAPLDHADITAHLTAHLAWEVLARFAVRADRGPR